MATNSYGSAAGANALTNEQRTFYNLDLIKRLLPYLPMIAEGQKRTIPRRTGGFGSGQIQWRKVAALATATTPLTEGVPPTAKDLSVTTVTANLSQYGDIVKLTDVLVGASIDDMAREAQSVLAEQAGQTLHALTMTELKSNSVSQIANGKANQAALTAYDVLTAYEIKKAVRTLHNAKAPRFPDGFYHGLLHPNQVFDLSNDPEWIDLTNQSGGSADMSGPSAIKYGANGFVGQFHNTRFRMSTEVPTHSTNANAYGALVYGPDWFGICDFVGMTLPTISPDTNLGVTVDYIPPSQKEKTDLLGQYGVAGWLVAFVAKILDSSRAVVVWTGVTA